MPTETDIDACSALLAALPAPGWARVGGVQLISREIRETLSAGAIDMLFAEAEHVAEGDTELGQHGSGAGRVYATVMVTIDLDRCAQALREPPDAATAQRVAELMATSVRVRRRLESLARPELARLSSVAPTQLQVAIESQVRSEGARILIDVDAMGTVEPATRVGG